MSTFSARLIGGMCAVVAGFSLSGCHGTVGDYQDATGIMRICSKEAGIFSDNSGETYRLVKTSKASIKTPTELSYKLKIGDVYTVNYKFFVAEVPFSHGATYNRYDTSIMIDATPSNGIPEGSC